MLATQYTAEYWLPTLVTAWDLWLMATVQHHERKLYHLSQAQEEIKIQNSKYGPIECTWLLHIIKLKNQGKSS